jgi:hypothetical protein
MSPPNPSVLSGRRSSSERIVVESICKFDDTLPLPAKTEIQRIVSSIAKGLIADIEAASLLVPARQERARIEAELATAETDTNVIELHPQAVELFQTELGGFGRCSRHKGRPARSGACGHI